MARTGLIATGMVKKTFYQGEEIFPQSFKAGGSLGAKKEISQSFFKCCQFVGREVRSAQSVTEKETYLLSPRIIGLPRKEVVFAATSGKSPQSRKSAHDWASHPHIPDLD